jgi:tellurite resistance protein TerC
MNLFASLSTLEVRDYNVPWFLYAAVIAILVIYALIEASHTKSDHEIKFKEAVKWSIVYISIALLFSIPIFIFVGGQAGAEYLAAWAVEKALSLDNLFVIGLIFTSLKVHPRFERRMLNYGIAGAIIFRLIFILAGIELLRRYAWVSLIFGLILMRAAWKTFQIARHPESENEEDITQKRSWKMLNKLVPVHHKFDEHKLTTIINGKRKLTLMAAVIIMIELTDIVFAVDSVPAVLAISPDRFIAYSSNVLALLGLRALFFVYQSVSAKFWALNWALSAILAWVSFKMISAPLGLHVPIGISLGVLGLLLGGGIFVSIKWAHLEPKSSSNKH